MNQAVEKNVSVKASQTPDYPHFGTTSTLINGDAVVYVIKKGEMEDFIPEDWLDFVNSKPNTVKKIICMLEVLSQLIGELTVRAEDIAELLNISREDVINCSETMQNYEIDEVVNLILDTQKYLASSPDERDPFFTLTVNEKLENRDTHYCSHYISQLVWNIAETVIESKNL